MDESGYVLYLKKDPYTKFYFNKNTGKNNVEVSQTINVTRQSLDVFGKYPYVYYVGNMNYRTFELSGVFIHTEDEYGNKKLTASEHAQFFEELVNGNRDFIVENSKKEKFLCDIQIKTISAPLLYEEDQLEYVTVSISCTEIGGV